MSIGMKLRKGSKYFVANPDHVRFGKRIPSICHHRVRHPEGHLFTFGGDVNSGYWLSDRQIAKLVEPYSKAREAEVDAEAEKYLAAQDRKAEKWLEKNGKAQEDPHRLHKDDPRKGQFSVTADGHYLGNDGFVVPRNFDEFYERYPKYVLNWVRVRLNHFQVDEPQDLLIYLKFSPARSFNPREADKACRDVIEAFDPGEQGGASEPNFRRYLNAALEQLFNAIRAKRQGHDIPPDREGYTK
ncbi:MAG: hypothetical protein WBL50_13280 [Candidatus Acidiferrum sp.]